MIDISCQIHTYAHYAIYRYVPTHCTKCGTKLECLDRIEVINPMYSPTTGRRLYSEYEVKCPIHGWIDTPYEYIENRRKQERKLEHKTSLEYFNVVSIYKKYKELQRQKRINAIMILAKRVELDHEQWKTKIDRLYDEAKRLGAGI